MYVFIHLHIINQVVFLTEMDCVLCEEKTEALYEIESNINLQVLRESRKKFSFAL